MATVASVTPTGGSAINLTDGCNFAAAGKYMNMPPKPGTKEYERMQIPVPGVNGTDTKNFGYRKQRLEFSAFYVAATPAAVIAAFEIDNAAVNAVLSTIVYGNTWTYCQCVKFEIVGKGIRPAIGAGYAYAEVEMAFDSLEI